MQDGPASAFVQDCITPLEPTRRKSKTHEEPTAKNNTQTRNCFWCWCCYSVLRLERRKKKTHTQSNPVGPVFPAASTMLWNVCNLHEGTSSPPLLTEHRQNSTPHTIRRPRSSWRHYHNVCCEKWVKLHKQNVHHSSPVARLGSRP